ncbi:MAG: LysR family transcriptional regulator [Actinomycetota bacterium]
MPLSPIRYDVRHLEALVAVAEEGTFRGAADILGYSQAAVSQQIAGLEAAVGAPVFDRPGGPKPVALTPVGRAILRHARAVLDRLDQARQEAEDVIAGTGGRLVIGTFQSVSVELVPQIVRRMRMKAPDLLMRAVEEDSNEELLAHLHDGEVDVAFLAGPVDDPLLDTVDLGTDPFLAVLPRRSPYTESDRVPLREVEQIGFIGEHHGSAQSYIDDGLRQHGIAPRYVYRTNDNGAMQAMVRSGLGAAIMPQLAIQTNDPDVVILPTTPAIAPRSIVLALPREPLRTPAAESFAEIAREVCAERLGPARRVTLDAR